MMNERSKPMVGRMTFIGLLALLSLPGWALAADDPQELSSQATLLQEVRVFEVAPVNRTAAVLTPNAQTPPPPASLSAEQVNQVLAGDDKSESSTQHSLETTILSAGRLAVDDKAVLTLLKPYTVHPETGIHLRGSDEGSVGVKVKVQQGVRYLLDFQVKSAVPGTYIAQVEGVKQEIDDPNGIREHVLLVLRPGSSGWTTVRLNRPDTDFMLYAVEITQAK